MTAIVHSRVQICLVIEGQSRMFTTRVYIMRKRASRAGTGEAVLEALRIGPKASLTQATDRDLKSGTTLARTLELSSFMERA